VSELHDSQVRLIKFNSKLDLVVSIDQTGNIEIWDPDTLSFPEDGRLKFELLSETDFYSLIENETFALSMEFSPDSNLLAIYCKDCKIRVFHFITGRLIQVIDESVQALIAAQESEEPDALVFMQNEQDFQAKIAGYKEAMRLWWGTMERAYLPSLAFDESSSLLCYSSPIGVKLGSAATGKLLKVYGKGE